MINSDVMFSVYVCDVQSKAKRLLGRELVEKELAEIKKLFNLDKEIYSYLEKIKI